MIIDDVIQVDAQGQPTLSTLNILNPVDVESISVLRDASAAIYGSRAAQGAIIVKTKRGHSGPPRISYSGKYGVMDAVSHAKQMNAHEYGVFANSFLLASERVKTGDSGYMNKLFSDNELEEMKGLDYNWLDKAWKAAFTQSHSVNVSGGSEKATYYAGVSYYKQGANLGNQDYSKWSYRTGIDITLTSDLKFSASLSGNTSQKETSFTKVANVNDGSYGSKVNGVVDYGYLAHMPRYIPWSMDLNGEEVYLSPSLGPHQTTSDINANGKFGAWNYYALLNSGSASINDSNGWDANFSMTYQVPFVQGLSLRGSYAISRSTSDNEQIALPYTLYYNRNMVNVDQHLYGAWQPTDFVKTDITEKSRVSYNDGISKRSQLNFFVNYQRQFGDHYVTGMFSVERGESYGHDKSLLYENPVKDQYNGMYNTAGTLSNNTTNGKNEAGSLSYLGRVTYNYASKYMLEFLFRSDASTKFAPENYWGFFPSLSAAWIMSEERWFKRVKWIDGLKFRMSWGRTGRDNIAPWLWKQTYQMKNDGGYNFGTAQGGTLGSALAANKSPNRSIHWDKVDKFNFGIDARFLRSRLNFGLDIYYDINDELLNQATVNELGTPFFAGGSVADSNFGRIDTYGADVSISWADKVGQVKYNVGVNFSLNGNRVKTWPESVVGYPSDNTISEGSRTKDYMPCWGYKVWRRTSSGDGLLRTSEDIDNYWAYLTEHADAVGGTPNYFGKKKEEMRVGMLAYQDLHGPMEDGVLTEADGR
ncbi:SusC/RagA family TonB-linked outer membrane protein [Bacteroides reticulotermitis]|uniref:SusC/RagA family TonB-linked outer membrane protein n=1 Tax=Bacteroides reticulotermitis TaxID=1133319 RepID=UPI0021CDCC1E|nr:SusC/RagA family TonB-linked outer membrane protein [Bacteroides reticulotermitis]